MTIIDLNCDVGEGVGNEPLLFPLISSCNIACGGHAGDQRSMEDTARLALAHGVRIGAHPSYPDREYFGRRSVKMADIEFRESIRAQVASLADVLGSLNTRLHHIKAHGALYNDLARGGSLAESYLEALEAYREKTILFVPCNATLATRARDLGFRVWEEAFLDRAYEADGSLVARNREGAVLSDPREIFSRLKEMAGKQRVLCADGSYLSLEADTYCLHGDTPNVVEILTFLTNNLHDSEITVSR